MDKIIRPLNNWGQEVLGSLTGRDFLTTSLMALENLFNVAYNKYGGVVRRQLLARRIINRTVGRKTILRASSPGMGGGRGKEERALSSFPLLPPTPKRACLQANERPVLDGW